LKTEEELQPRTKKKFLKIHTVDTEEEKEILFHFVNF